MFDHKMIKARLNEKPFRPVRIVTSSGESYDVPHPDLVWVGLRDLQVGFSSSEDLTTYDRTVRIAILHVVALEDLATPAKTTSNGAV